MDVGAAQWARVLPLSLGIVLMLCCKSDEQINSSWTKGAPSKLCTWQPVPGGAESLRDRAQSAACLSVSGSFQASWLLKLQKAFPKSLFGQSEYEWLW